MKLEDQVCNLELSKKLKELGVKQESLFYHYNEPYNDGEDDWVITTFEDYKTTYENKSEPYSAYTVAELGEMLPVGFLFGKGTDKWFCSGEGFDDENEANTRAKMLIDLIENDLIKP